MEDSLIYVGYRQFTSKKNGQDYKTIEFITVPKKSSDGSSMICNQVSVFTTAENFSKFVQNNKILSTVKVPFEINGDKVHYLI